MVQWDRGSVPYRGTSWFSGTGDRGSVPYRGTSWFSGTGVVSPIEGQGDRGQG